MQFDSSPQVSKAGAILFATFAIVFLYFALFVAIGIAAFLLLLIAIFAILLSVGAALARFSVRINSDKAQVEKRFSTLFIDRSTRFPFADYRGVRVATGGRGGVGAPTVVYFVQMVGNRNLQVTSASGDLERAQREARELADATGLPLI